MIIPSIDIQSGNAVQLIGGKTKAIEAGNPLMWGETFSIASEIAVIDLDAAMGTGSNRSIIRELIKRFKCRVGGGVRTIDEAKMLLDEGAQRVIIGTKASLEFLNALPKERTIAALDARHGEVVVEGWIKNTNESVEKKISELKGSVGGFLITLVETEGSMKGIDIARCKALKEICGETPLTVAGGVASVDEIAQLDALGIDVQVGMALYSGAISFVDGFLAPFKKLPEPWPTVVCDEGGIALGLVWSTAESVRTAFQERRGVYFSRSRRSLWRKGETSGATQELVRVDLDCDRDALRFTVKQKNPGFCHTESYTCWGEATGVTKLCQTLEQRAREELKGSYSQRLFNDSDLLNAKILEEAKELIEAKSSTETLAEGCDLLYFTLTKLIKNKLSINEISRELDMRALKVTRRGGDKKDLDKEEYVRAE